MRWSNVGQFWPRLTKMVGKEISNFYKLFEIGELQKSMVDLKILSTFENEQNRLRYSRERALQGYILDFQSSFSRTNPSTKLILLDFDIPQISIPKRYVRRFFLYGLHKRAICHNPEASWAKSSGGAKSSSWRDPFQEGADPAGDHLAASASPKGEERFRAERQVSDGEKILNNFIKYVKIHGELMWCPHTNVRYQNQNSSAVQKIDTRRTDWIFRQKTSYLFIYPEASSSVSDMWS